MDDITNKPRENYFEVAKSIWNWEAGEELKRINVPTLIMVGEKDSRTPPRFSHLLHAEIPNSRLVIVKDAGHCLALERPQVVNAETIKFLKSLGY
jgi:pimeloyl-ACP methyl ester carboxylesterase